MATAPPFVPINIPNVVQQAAATDTQGYNWSDADFARRFPQLVAGRDFNITDAGNQLAGGQDPAVTAALDKSGLSANYGNTETEQARNMGSKDILSKEKRDRSYFSNLLNQNPQRQIGLSGQDIAQMRIANTAGVNNYNQGIFGSRINSYNAALANQTQANQGYANAATSVFGDLAKFYQNQQLNNSLSSGYYNDPASLNVGGRGY